MLIEQLLLPDVLVQLKVFIFEDCLQTIVLKPLQLLSHILLVFLDPVHHLLILRLQLRLPCKALL
jgi:hypothetical protein